MRARFAAPFVALSFLTVVPLHRDEIPPSAFPRSLAYFPAVGLLIGAFVAVADAIGALVLPVGVVAALDLVVLALCTGGLHLDGLADTIDGLLVRGDRERRLAIMRGGTIGAFAAAGLTVVLLTEYGALVSLASRDRALALVVGTVLARWAMVMALWGFPYARDAGVGLAFKRDLGWREVAVAAAGTAAVVLGAGARAVAAGAAAVAATCVIGRSAESRLGGLTGDVYGACGELTFLGTLVIWTIAPR